MPRTGPPTTQQPATWLGPSEDPTGHNWPRAQPGCATTTTAAAGGPPHPPAQVRGPHSSPHLTAHKMVIPTWKTAPDPGSSDPGPAQDPNSSLSGSSLSQTLPHKRLLHPRESPFQFRILPVGPGKAPQPSSSWPTPEALPSPSSVLPLPSSLLLYPTSLQPNPKLIPAQSTILLSYFLSSHPLLSLESRLLLVHLSLSQITLSLSASSGPIPDLLHYLKKPPAHPTPQTVFPFSLSLVQTSPPLFLNSLPLD